MIVYASGGLCSVVMMMMCNVSDVDIVVDADTMLFSNPYWI